MGKERAVIIDLVEGDEKNLLRYEAAIAPRIGESVSTFIDGKREWRVTKVDHLIALSGMGGDTEYLQLITVTVEAV